MDSTPPKFEHVGKTELPQDKSVVFCVWRKASPENSKIYFRFLKVGEIQLDDLIFCESSNYSGYARIVDFVRHEDGSISDYTLQNADIDYQTSLLMAKSTHDFIEELLKTSTEKELCVVVCLKSRVQKDRK